MAHGMSDDRKPEFDRAGALLRIAAKDRQALRRLYDEVSPRLYAILLRMVKLRPVADELLQETFVTIWNRAHEYAESCREADAWIVSITRRRAIDRLRVGQRHSLVSGAEDPCPLNSFCAKLTPSAMKGQIAFQFGLFNLTTDERNAITLCYAYGFSHEELAKEIAVPLATAKSWIRSGLRHLIMLRNLSSGTTLPVMNRVQAAHKYLRDFAE